MRISTLPGYLRDSSRLYGSEWPSFEFITLVSGLGGGGSVAGRVITTSTFSMSLSGCDWLAIDLDE
ncbi:hypothetical protein SBDP1_310035 [Syntrophobacter sp. SbD1]|nr:hypothetical protein SBDP1_310035 [Syntrophobacter sp. SbD1]